MLVRDLVAELQKADPLAVVFFQVDVPDEDTEPFYKEVSGVDLNGFVFDDDFADVNAIIFW